MKKIIPTIFHFIIFLTIFENFIFTRSSNAFFPKINEPNKQELSSTSKKIGATAIQLIQFGENDQAIKLLKLAIKLNPKEKDFWISLAEAEMRSDQKYKALSSLDEAIKLNPKEQDIYFTKASIYMDLNNPKKAKVYIKKGLSINKNSEIGYFQLGNAEMMLNNYQSALFAFQESSKINGKFWQSINNEGLVLFELDKPNAAMLKFKKALKISNNAEPMLALGVVLFSSDNNSSESIKLATKALSSNPLYVSTNYQAKQLWGEKLQRSTKLLFKRKEMKKVVIKAKEKSK